MESRNKVQYYNPVYDALEATEPFFPVISTTTIGAMIGGLPGAVVGFILGSTDLLANHYDIYDKPYLTSGILGAGTLSRFSINQKLEATSNYIKYTPKAIGFTVGALLPTGALNAYYDKIASPYYGALYGYSYAGPYGAAIGATAGAVDETLAHFNITDKPYLSTAIKDISITKLTLPILPSVLNYLPNFLGPIKTYPLQALQYLTNQKVIAETIGVTWAALELCKQQNTDDSEVKKLAQNMLEVYSDAIEDKELRKHIEYQAIAITTTSLLTQAFTLKLGKYYQETKSGMEGFNKLTTDTWAKFVSQFNQFALFLPIFVGGMISERVLNMFFGTKGTYIIASQLTQELVEDENIFKLMHNNTAQVTDANSLIKRRYSDITNIASKGSGLLSDALSSTVKGVFGINYLTSVNAQNIIVYSAFYSSLSSSLSSYLSKRSGGYEVRIAELTDKKTSLEEYFQKNADSVIQREENAFIRAKLSELTTQLRQVGGEKTTWDFISSTWFTTRSILDFLVNYLMVAHHLNKEAIEFKDYGTILFTTEDVLPMLSWYGQKAGDIVSVQQSITRLDELKNRIRTSDEPNLPSRTYKTYDKSNTWICLDSLSVSAEEKSLIASAHTCLTKNVVAVTGESHSGKSTMLKLVKGLKHSGAQGNGEITFYTQDGTAPKILMVSQHYNIPPYIKLLEAITLKPLEEAQHLEHTVKELMLELKIDADQSGSGNLASLLHEEKDWNQFITSGGARKKLMAIWIILEGPDIAILDEIFVGLDREAIKNIQNIFRARLPNTKFLIVDHEAKAHNFEGFYEENLHVEDKTLHVGTLPITIEDSITDEIYEIMPAAESFYTCDAESY